MEKLKFVSKAFFLFEKREQEIILKNMQKEGFVVSGFEKSPWMAPKTRIISSFTGRRKGKKGTCYEFLLHCIRGLVDKNGTLHPISEYARTWKESDNDDDVDTKLSEIKEKINAAKVIKNDLREETIQEIKRIKRENDKLRSLICTKDKIIKELEKKVSKMEENLLKENTQHRKETEHNKSIINELNINSDVLKEENTHLCNEIIRLKQLRRKVACLGTTARESDDKKLSNKYEITYYEKWDKKSSEQLKKRKFDEVWAVYGRINYNDFVEIKDCFKDIQVLDFIDYETMIEGANVNDR